jgi:hypothetical protein
MKKIWWIVIGVVGLLILGILSSGILFSPGDDVDCEVTRLPLNDGQREYCLEDCEERYEGEDLEKCRDVVNDEDAEFLTCGNPNEACLEMHGNPDEGDLYPGDTCRVRNSDRGFRIHIDCSICHQVNIIIWSDCRCIVTDSPGCSFPWSGWFFEECVERV